MGHFNLFRYNEVEERTGLALKDSVLVQLTVTVILSPCRALGVIISFLHIMQQPFFFC